MSDDCPDPKCKIELIRCLNKKVSKSVLGASLGILVAALSTIAFLTYNAYDNSRDVLAEETTKAKTLAEDNRKANTECRSNIEVIKEKLNTINERLREDRADQKEANKKILETLEELKRK